ncbi:MAG: type II toxin-antitoxin system HicA family toxin [Bacteroidetes bacterium]|nr:type II toxin-antitoxin system HicA family toxin [Bacteroidota bacterium]
MGKLQILSAKDLCKILESHGFVYLRQKGSHIIMQKKMAESTVTIPVPNHKEIKIGTLLSIIRQSGLSRNLFE